jgi:predicted acyl esterase
MSFVEVSRIRSRFDEGLTARDGTRLSLDVYMPAEPGSYPVLVTRTPYNNNRTDRVTGATTLLPSPADRFKKIAAHGFIVVA